MRWDPCLLDGRYTDTSAISSPSRLGLGKEVYNYTSYIKSFLSGGRNILQYRIALGCMGALSKKRNKKEKWLRISHFFFGFILFLALRARWQGRGLVGWWYGSCKVIKLWRWCPIYRIGLSILSNPLTKYTTLYRYRHENACWPAKTAPGRNEKLEILPPTMCETQNNNDKIQA